MSTTKEGHFLIIHNAGNYDGFYDVVLDWVAENLPEERPRFELLNLPCQLSEPERFRLMIPWLQDPVEAWCEQTYQQALALTAECDRAGIPVINRVERLSRAAKLQGSELIRQAGLRTPKMFPIVNPQSFHDDFFGLEFPLFVRENLGHGKLMVRADTPDEARKIPLREFTQPIAVELVDLPGATDGLYRKYRYVVAGEFGVTHHLQASREWVTRGGNRVINDTSKTEELSYINAPSPHFEAFQKAKRALGLDFVAFDYSLDHQGVPIIWEANPYPFIQFSRRDLLYRNDAIHRTIAIIVASYFRTAAIELPAQLAASLGGDKPISALDFSPPPGGPSPSWKTPPAKVKVEVEVESPRPASNFFSRIRSMFRK
jgi:hypothetical protein